MARTDNKKGLTDLQVDKISKIIIGYAERSPDNGIINFLAPKLKTANLADKKRFITSTWQQAFTLLSLINLGQEDKRSIEEFEKELESFFIK